MKLSLISFTITVLGVVVSIVALMLGSDSKSSHRTGFGIITLFLTLIFFLVGIFSFVGSGETDASIGIDSETSQLSASESVDTDGETSQSPTPQTLTNTSLPSQNSCLATEHTFLGNGWVSQAVFILTQSGASRIFSHCPPMTTIQYNSMSVDDEIQKVELVCRNSLTDITGFFQPFSVEGELLLHWRSSRITLESECRIDFTIKDSAGVNIGLQIKKSEP